LILTLLSDESSAAAAGGASAASASGGGQEAELWTVKYAPKTIDKLIGQQGEKSPANKLKVRERREGGVWVLVSLARLDIAAS
jgi:hypothetical protein